MPSTVSPLNQIRDCETDSKGNIWYTVTLGGLYSQSPDGVTWKSYSGVPISDSSGWMGLLVDQNTDSVYVGSNRGSIQVGKDGVFHSLPSIPMNNPSNSIAKARTRDLFMNSSGKLVALTDSLAWWFDGSQWFPIGISSQYKDSVPALDVGVKLPNGDIVATGNLISGNSISAINIYGYGLSVGPSGTLFAGEGPSSQRLFVSHSPYLTVDTLKLNQPGENILGSNSIWSVFEDENGWVWIPETGRMLFLKNDTVRYVKPETGFTMYLMPQKFIMTPDSTLWICGTNSLMRYSEHYQIPQEVLNAYNGNASLHIHPVSSPLTMNIVSRGIDISTPNDEWTVTILSYSGQIIWNSEIQGTRHITLNPGIWIVHAVNNRGQTFQRTFAVVH